MKFLKIFFICTLLSTHIQAQNNRLSTIERHTILKTKHNFPTGIKSGIPLIATKSVTQSLPQQFHYYNWETNQWNLDHRYQMSYYPDGSWHIMTAYNVNTLSPSVQVIYEYTPAGHKASEITQVWDQAQVDPKWVDAERGTYLYDANDNLIEYLYEQKDQSTGNWVLNFGGRWYYTYNSNNQITEIVFSENWEGIWEYLPEREVYTYDNEGRITSRTIQAQINDEWKDDGIDIYTYDPINGSLMQDEFRVYDHDANQWNNVQIATDITWHNYRGENTGWFYDGSDLKSYTYKNWDGNAYVDIERNNITHPDENQSFIHTRELYDNGWVYDYKQTILNDSHKNRTLNQTELYNRDQQKWDTVSVIALTNTYDNENLAEVITKVPPTSGAPLENSYKQVFSDYIILNPLGIKSESSINYINIYPNPTTKNSNLTLDLKESSSIQIALYNSLGQKLMTVLPQTNVNSGNYNYTIDLPNTGLFFVQLTVNGQTSCVKLISQ